MNINQIGMEMISLTQCPQYSSRSVLSNGITHSPPKILIMYHLTCHIFLFFVKSQSSDL